MTKTRSQIDLRTWIAMAMLAAVAYVVMYLSKMLPSVNGFLDFDFKDVVICISGFIYGPLPAAIISIVVAVIEAVTISHTGPIGLLMNVLATCSFCCTATFVYKRNHTMKGAVVGLSLGVVSLVVVMLLWNYLITPIYQGVPRDVVVSMLPTVFLPFNLAKGGMNMAATLLLYKPVVTALRKAHLVAPSTNSTQGRKLNVGFLLFSLALLATFVTLALVLWGVI
jgi:riboflavin transporter FmnP